MSVGDTHEGLDEATDALNFERPDQGTDERDDCPPLQSIAARKAATIRTGENLLLGSGIRNETRNLYDRFNVVREITTNIGYC